MTLVFITKTIHLSCIVLSFSGFFVRGIWMLQGSARLKQRWVKMAPHIIDTLLLTSAILLAVQMRISPLEHSWLMAKIVALLVYIGAGMVALRFGRSRNERLVAWVFGLLTFLYIVSVAFSKSVLGWLVYI
jgi:uncharacterized membrane protein SirB2